MMEGRACGLLRRCRRDTPRFPRAAVPALLVLLPVASFQMAGRSGPLSTYSPDPAYGQVEILRDSWGIAHVFADTDEGAMYGLGYATAEDRAFQMHFSLRIIQGRLSEVVGNIRQTGKSDTSLASDLLMRTMGYHTAAQALVSRLDSATVGLLEAYSAGINGYIFSHRADLLYLFNRTGLEPEPWTPADCIVSWWHLGQFFAGDGLSDLANLHNLQQPPQRQDPVVDDSAAVIQQADVDAGWIRALNEFVGRVEPKRRREVADDRPRFSHAWVVGGSRTSTGSAVLVSDPQTQVRNPSLFYEFHVRGRTFNARGIGVAGSPGLLIGFNENLAWGATALGADQADLFVLSTNADRYLFDGEWRAMRIRKETVRVRGEEDREVIIRETHLGPVVTALAADVHPGEEVALKRVPLCDTETETIQSALAMMRARNAAEFDVALEKWRFPSINVVFGDRAGRIGFRTAAAFPYRSLQAPDGGNAAHDGSSSRFDWIGMVPPSLAPHVMDPVRGFLASANHRAIASFYPIPLFAGTGSGGDTVRSWRLRELLESRTVMTPEDVLAVHHDTVNAARREIVRWGRLLRSRSTPGLPEEVLQALDHLEVWHTSGGRSVRTVPGTELAELIPLNFRATNTDLALTYGGGEAGLCFFLKSLDQRLAADPGAQLSAPEAKFIQDALASAWRSARQNYGADPARWQAAAAQALRARKMGYFESLDGFPSLDPVQDLNFPDLDCVDGGTIKSQVSQSYTQWVPLHDVDSARTLLPVGLSEHPDNPSRLSCYQAWQKGELHPAPLTRSSVEPYVVRRTTLTASGSR